MQTQCICIIMTILDSSSLMFTASIQVYNTMSLVFVHRSRWHTLRFQVHWSSRVAGPAERPGIHKVHGLPSPAPTLESALVRLWSYRWAASGAVAAPVPIAERNGPSISSPNHRDRQPSQDWGPIWGDGQNVDDLFSRQGFIYQLGAVWALGDPRLHLRTSADTILCSYCIITMTIHNGTQ